MIESIFQPCQLELMLDNEAETETTARVFQHLDSCVACQSKWTENLSLRERLHQFRNNINVPKSLPQRISESLVPEQVDVPSSAKKINAEIRRSRYETLTVRKTAIVRSDRDLRSKMNHESR